MHACMPKKKKKKKKKRKKRATSIFFFLSYFLTFCPVSETVGKTAIAHVGEGQASEGPMDGQWMRLSGVFGLAWLSGGCAERGRGQRSEAARQLPA
ncbi:hypothetical protein BKA80DRAFT_284097 [Phyllosticta citrichinensis]